MHYVSMRQCLEAEHTRRSSCTCGPPKEKGRGEEEEKGGEAGEEEEEGGAEEAAEGAGREGRHHRAGSGPSFSPAAVEGAARLRAQ